MSYQQLKKNLRPYIDEQSYFVNIGANDGVSNDPIYPFLEKYNLSGIAVEPSKHTFAHLKRNLGHYPGVILENVAISDTPVTFYHFSDSLMAKSGFLLSQWSSTWRGALEIFIDNFERGTTAQELVPLIGRPTREEWLANIVEDTSIPVISFNALMAKHKVSRIDFLNIDVEGLDMDILYSIDMKKYAPRVLCIETQVLDVDASMKAENHRRFDAFLQQHGYRFLQNFTLVSKVYVRD